MEISKFLIALVLVSVVATTFVMSSVDLTTKYGVTYDNDSLDVFQDVSEIHTLATELEDKTNNAQVESGLLDVVGSYIGRALDAIKLSMSSFSLFENMASKATEKLGLPSYFLSAAITIMLIIIILGVFVSAMIKHQL
jgi:hypothetical protein